MAQQQTSSGGIGFVGLLTIVFVALKLTEVIDWSWVWVLSLIWIPASVVLGLLTIVGIDALIVARVKR